MFDDSSVYDLIVTLPVKGLSNVTWQNCGECSFPSDTENNHNIQFLFSCCILSVPVNSSQLQLNLKPNTNEINSPYIPFHHECPRCFKKRPLEHSNQIMFIKQFLRIIGYCSFEQ